MSNASGTLTGPFVRTARIAAIGAAAALLTLLGASPAHAHDAVTAQSPVADSTVTDALSEVSVTFSEPPLGVDGARLGLDVLDPSGASVARGDLRVDGATLSRNIATTVQGVYTVRYQTVASDGHNTSGEYTFTFAGPVASVKFADGTSTPIPGGPVTAQPLATVAPSSVAPTTAAPGLAAEGVSPGPGAAEESPAVQVGLVVGAIIGGLVVVGAIITIIISVRRRQGLLPPNDGQATGGNPRR